MTTVNRDLLIVDLLSHFQRMTTGQILGAVYPGNRSDTPCYRALGRLQRANYIKPFKRRHLKTGAKGSAEYVWQLGPVGWSYIGYESKYESLESFEPHQLAIGDAFVALRALEHAGKLEIIEFECEPSNRVRVGNIELRPDFYARLQDSKGASRWWLEIDLGSEHVADIKEKIRRYCRAYADADSNGKWRTFPVVLFVVRDEARGNDTRRCEHIRRWIDEAAEVKGLFKVCTFDQLEVTLLA